VTWLHCINNSSTSREGIYEILPVTSFDVGKSEARGSPTFEEAHEFIWRKTAKQRRAVCKKRLESRNQE
jgi:hypothetical protein